MRVSEPAAPPLPTNALREVFLTYAVAFLGTAALGFASPFHPWLGELAAVGTALLFFALALRAARKEPGGAERFGIDLGRIVDPGEHADEGLFRALRNALPSGLREAGFAFGLAALVFPPFIVGFYFWHQPTRAFQLSAPGDLASFVVGQFLMVALSEEAFFRGFVQTRLHDAWKPNRTILGAQLNVRVLVVQAALFALVHIATGWQLDRLATFFPGLVFGWMRAKRGGIGAALGFHALCNILADFLVRGWLS